MECDKHDTSKRTPFGSSRFLRSAKMTYDGSYYDSAPFLTIFLEAFNTVHEFFLGIRHHQSVSAVRSCIGGGYPSIDALSMLLML